MITRRGLLAACIATFAAPAIVRAGSLMALSVPKLVLWGDGVHDDTAALKGLIGGVDVRKPNGERFLYVDGVAQIGSGNFLVKDTLYMDNSKACFLGSTFNFREMPVDSYGIVLMNPWPEDKPPFRHASVSLATAKW